jgi:hypothetical protein
LKVLLVCRRHSATYGSTASVSMCCSWHVAYVRRARCVACLFSCVPLVLTASIGDDWDGQRLTRVAWLHRDCAAAPGAVKLPVTGLTPIGQRSCRTHVRCRQQQAACDALVTLHQHPLHTSPPNGSPPAAAATPIHALWAMPAAAACARRSHRARIER